MLLLKSSRYFFFAPHALAREPNLQKTWKLECPSALPCSIFPQNLTKIVQSVQLLCNSLEIEAIKRPMRTSIHFIHYPVLTSIHFIHYPVLINIPWEGDRFWVLVQIKYCIREVYFLRTRTSTAPHARTPLQKQKMRGGTKSASREAWQRAHPTISLWASQALDHSIR